jgi:hypothetical protein
MIGFLGFYYRFIALMCNTLYVLVFCLANLRFQNVQRIQKHFGKTTDDPYLSCGCSSVTCKTHVRKQLQCSSEHVIQPQKRTAAQFAVFSTWLRSFKP